MASFTFNQANGTNLTTIDAKWTGNPTLFEVQSSILRITNVSTFNDRYAYFSDGQGGTQESEVTLMASPVFTGGEILEVSTQMQSLSALYSARVDGTNLTLRRNGSFQAQAAHGMTMSASGNIVRITSNSGTGVVNAYANGSLITTFTDGTPLTGGFPGIYFNAQGAVNNIGITTWTDNVSGVVSHPSSGALAAQASTVAGSATHLTLHATSGALAAQAATIAGTAADHHSNIGALVAQAATVAGTAAHRTLHTTSGALTGQAATVAGTAAHQNATSGALVAQAATIAGSADHTTAGASHSTSGALSGQDATVAGSATHLTLHATSGALAAQAATVAGSAVHPHTTSGALAAQAAAISGTAADQFATTGALVAQAATVSGTAVHTSAGSHPTSGDLAAGSATISGAAEVVHIVAANPHGFEMGGNDPKPRRRNLVYMVPDDKPRSSATPVKAAPAIDFATARQKAADIIKAAATEHAASKVSKAVRYGYVRTSLKPLSPALGDWNWINLYQRLYDAALTEQLRREVEILDQLEEDSAIAFLLLNL